MQSKNSYTGTIAMVALDSEEIENIFSPKKGRVLYLPEDGSRFVPVNLHDSEALGKSVIKKLVRKRPQRDLSSLDSHPNNVDEILFSGRNRLALFLNSNGGYVSQLRRLEDLAYVAKMHAGKIFAFGGANVKSAAAELMLSAVQRRRFIIPETEMFFHLGCVRYEYEEIAEVEDSNNEIGAFRRILLRHTRNHMRNWMDGLFGEALAQQQTEIDLPVTLTAAQCHELGYGRITANMRKSVHSALRIKREQYSETAIDEFLCEIEDMQSD